MVEALLVGTAGGILGLGIGAAAERLAFGLSPAGSSASTSLVWAAIAFVAGLAIATLTVLVPALRDLRGRTVAQARHTVGRSRTPLWMKGGVDFILIAGALLVFWASSANNYSLVLAPRAWPRSRCPTGRSWARRCCGGSPTSHFSTVVARSPGSSGH